jgi:hypothetical protein
MPAFFQVVLSKPFSCVWGVLFFFLLGGGGGGFEKFI